MKRFLLTFFGAILGALLGYLYYYFIGCKVGTCPITSNPYISILWGMVLGIILFFPNKKKINEN
ncbi:MAG: DUF6132 family protein [Candidatus Kapaibacteriales bacterium]